FLKPLSEIKTLNFIFCNNQTVIILLRYFLFIFSFILFSKCSSCQQSGNYKRDSVDLGNVKEMQIRLDSNDRFTGVNQFPFKSILIEDVRFDTTQVGIYSVLNNIFIPAIKNYKINFKDGLGSSLGIYLNNFFKSNTGDKDIELVCFVKKLSIVKRDTLTDNISLQRTYGKVSFRAEVFLRNGTEFYTAFKIDTALTESISIKKKEIVDEMKDYMLMPVLKLLQNEISNTAWDKILKKKSFSKSVVHENYFNSRFNLPVLTQSPKKGIYKTFSEFKNNSPSIIDFEVKKGKLKTVSLIDKKGNYLVTTKMFGFSDGEKYWILKGNFSFPLIRTGNSFEFFLTVVNNLKILLAIDMENGDVY
ncbi:MAG: hypothetical protein ABI419_10310, partial [Ginsengibacter sp.]